MNDEVVEALDTFINNEVTPDNYDIQDNSWRWSKKIVNFLYMMGYLNDRD